MKFPKWFWAGLLIALFLRLALIPNPGFEADVSFWKAWGLATVDKGIIEGLKVSNSNYPTPFLYVLGAMVWVYKLAADPHNFNAFWNNSNLLFLTISKALPILADFGIAAILFRMSGPLLSLVYLLNPISLIDGAWWGQVDSVGVFIFLVACLLVLKKQPFLAGIIYMIGVMTKLQNMIYGPIFFLFIWKTLGYNGLIRAITGATLAFFGLNIEFFLARNMDRVIASLTENYDYFPLMSLNAYNLWWIVSGAKGMAMSDKFLALGIMNAKAVGLILFSSVYLFAVLRQMFQRLNPASLQGLTLKNYKGNSIDNNNAAALKLSTLRTFLESLILVNAAFFLFQTQSHDRYAFPLSVFLLLWAPFYIATRDKRHETRWRLFIFSFFLFTIFYFYNLHTALIINYPYNGIPGLSSLTQPFFTITTSVVLLGLFGVFLFHLVIRTPKVVNILTTVFLLTTLTMGSLPLILKKPVSLTKLTPYVSEQGYGKRSINMPVNSFLGYPKQSYLSVQYAFYRTGIGTHSPSFMNYDVAGHFKKFTTDFGIDTEAGGKGTAIFEIYGDDKLLYKSEKIGRYDNPRHAEVDVTGVRKLGLVTTDAGDGKSDDHTDWLNPKLWP